MWLQRPGNGIRPFLVYTCSRCCCPHMCNVFCFSGVLSPGHEGGEGAPRGGGGRKPGRGSHRRQLQYVAFSNILEFLLVFVFIPPLLTFLEVSVTMFSICSWHLEFSLIKTRSPSLISKSPASWDYHSRWSAAERHGVHHLISTGKPRQQHSGWMYCLHHYLQMSCTDMYEIMNKLENNAHHLQLNSVSVLQIPTVQQIQFSWRGLTPSPNTAAPYQAPRSPDDLWPCHGG